MNKVIETELKYSKCFSHSIENKDYIVFKDPLIKDMYSHNFTYIKEPMEEAHFVKTFHDLLNHSKEKPFLNILSDWPLDAYEKHLKDFNYRKGIYEYYEIDEKKVEDIVPRQDLTYKILRPDLLEDALAFDLRTNKEESGETFVIDRFKRRAQVYLQDQGVNNYLFYYKGEIVAHCDLFFNGSLVKLEDLNVRPDMQRKGFGKSILRLMFDLAKKKGVEKLYLIAHAEETAREMYQKSGMKKIGEKTEIFIKL